MVCYFSGTCVTVSPFELDGILVVAGCTVSNKAFKYFTYHEYLSDIIILYPIALVAMPYHRCSHQDAFSHLFPKPKPPAFTLTYFTHQHPAPFNPVTPPGAI